MANSIVDDGNIGGDPLELLIPAEELALLQLAVDEALELAQGGQWERGRQKLRRGLRETRAWQAEAWGPALTGYWLWALRRYDALSR